MDLQTVKKKKEEEAVVPTALSVDKKEMKTSFTVMT